MTTSSKPDSIGFGHPSVTGKQYTDLVSVSIRSKSGALYVFPDMSLSVVKSILPENGRVLGGQPSFTLLNISAAVVSIPFIIIAEILVDDEVLWSAYANVSDVDERREA